MPTTRWRLNLSRALLIATIFGASAVTASAPVFYVTKVQSLQEYAQQPVGVQKMRTARIKIGFACYKGKLPLGYTMNNKNTWREIVKVDGDRVIIIHADLCKSA